MPLIDFRDYAMPYADYISDRRFIITPLLFFRHAAIFA